MGDNFPLGQFTPGQFTPGQFTPGQFTPGQFTPGRFTPGKFTPGRFTPGHIIESNSSEEGVSSYSSVAGDEIYDPGVPGSFSWSRSEGEPAGYWFLRESR